MRVLVADDEALARRRLVRMLAAWDDVEVVGEASDGLEAQSLVDQQRPDVILLDIDMPECDGLTFASTVPLPAVVFVTAHRQHAVEAFEIGAIDYLLKPVTRERLRQALDRVALAPSHVSPIPEPVADERLPPRLCAREGDTLHVFDARTITRLHASDKATLFWVDGVEYVLESSLSELEVRLAPWAFLRVHRSELVNLDAVVRVRLGAGESYVELRDGALAPVSRRMLARLRQHLG